MIVSTLVLGPLCLCLPWSLVHYGRVRLGPWSTMVVYSLVLGPLESLCVLLCLVLGPLGLD